MKIVYIGAGSHDFGRGQVVDVMTAEDLKGATISLVDLIGPLLHRRPPAWS